MIHTILSTNQLKREVWVSPPTTTPNQFHRLRHTIPSTTATTDVNHTDNHLDTTLDTSDTLEEA